MKICTTLLLLCAILLVKCQTSWVYCTTEGDSNKCKYPEGFDNLVKYGYNDDQGNGWYTYAWAKNVHGVICQDRTFGDPNPNQHKNADGKDQNTCYFQQFEKAEDENDKKWKTCASKDGRICYLPKGGGTYQVRYGTENRYYQRKAEGWIYCSGSNFGDPYSGKDKKCQYRKIENDNNVKWTIAARSGNTGYFNDPTTIWEVKYGGILENGTEVFIYRDISGPNFQCRKETFGDAKIDGVDKYCYIRTSQELRFANPVGQWYLAGSCRNCGRFNHRVSQGVTSETSIAKSYTWGVSVTSTLKAGIFFVESELSVAVSNEIAEATSNSLSQSSTQWCDASCGTSESKGDIWSLWAWKMVIDEDTTDGVLPFVQYTCNWICINESSSLKTPKCPLTQCKDTECQECLN